MQEPRTFFNLLEESFPGMKANIARCETLGFPWVSKPFLKEEKGEIVSHAGLLEYPMLVEGKWRKGAALHAICTKTSYRGRGLASELIQEALGWAKERFEFVILYTEIPDFYKKLSFQYIPEHRFRLSRTFQKGIQSLQPLNALKDKEFFLRFFRDREPLSNHVWVKDDGTIAAFNTLFATYPAFWSLHYCPALKAILSFHLVGRTLHLFDVIAEQIPALDSILDHLPEEVEEIIFYFSPERLTLDSVPEPYLYDKGHLMVHGDFPSNVKPFMIPPLSRC